MLIVAGIPNQPAKLILLGMHNSQQATMGRPMNPIVQTAWSEMVLKPMDSVTLADAPMSIKFNKFLEESVNEQRIPQTESSLTPRQR
jgi:hypothetical protein